MKDKIRYFLIENKRAIIALIFLFNFSAILLIYDNEFNSYVDVIVCAVFSFIPMVGYISYILLTLYQLKHHLKDVNDDIIHNEVLNMYIGIICFNMSDKMKSKYNTRADFITSNIKYLLATYNLDGVQKIVHEFLSLDMTCDANKNGNKVVIKLLPKYSVKNTLYDISYKVISEIIACDCSEYINVHYE